MKNNYFTLVAVLLIAAFSYAQDSKVQELISAYSLEKNDSTKLIKAEKAFNYIEKLKSKDVAQYITVLHDFSQLQFGNYQDADAVVTAEKLYNLLKIKKDKKYISLQAETATFLASTYDYLQNPTKAIDYNNEFYLLQKEIYGSKSEEVANVLLQSSVLYSRIDNVDEQIKSLDAARSILENITVKDKQLLFNMNQYYVFTLISYGDIPRAKIFLDKLNATYNQNKTNRDFMSYGLDTNHTIPTNLASLILANVTYYKLEAGSEKELKKTVAFFENYLKNSSKSLTIGDLDEINNFYCELAVHYTTLKKEYSNAENCYKAALDYNKNYPAGRIKLLYHQGWTAFKFQKYDKAAIYFEQCTKIKGLENFIELISLYKYYGTTLFYLNSTEKSQYYLKKVEDFYKDNSTYQGFMSLNNLTDVGNLYISIYKKNKDKLVLKKAFTCFTKASNLFTKIYQGDSFNDNLNVRVKSINEGLLFCAIILGEKKAEVFELVEKNKSDFLWASFLKNYQLKVFEEPKKLVNTLNLLEEQKQLLSIKLKDQKSNEKQTKTEIAALDQKINNAQKELETKYSSFYNFTESANSLKSIQKQLKSNEVLIDYAVFDSMIYAFKVTTNDIALLEISKTAPDLQKKCNVYLSDLKNINPNVNKHL